MDLINKMKLYNKYIAKQAALTDIDSVCEKAEEIAERISDIASYPETNEKWRAAVKKAVGECTEYNNLCVYLCRKLGGKRAVIVPDVLVIIPALCELMRRASELENEFGEVDELYDSVSDLVLSFGSDICVQEEKYWLYSSELFSLDKDGSIAENLKRDLEAIERGEKVDMEIPEDNEKEKKSEEDEAKEILKAVLDTPSCNNRVTTSWVQRRFNMGYGKASKMIDILEALGYVESFEDMKKDGGHGRKILVTADSI